MMKNKIQHISFLLGEEREIVKNNSEGLFEFQKKKKSRSSYNSKKLSLSRPLKATEVIRHVAVRNGDPVITMVNGDKMRVYLSGDPQHVVVEALSILETHEIERLAKLKEKIEEPGREINTFDMSALEGLFTDFPEW